MHSYTYISEVVSAWFTSIHIDVNTERDNKKERESFRVRGHESKRKHILAIHHQGPLP